jgi:1,4-dihydroxy-2-naphthoate polyprenyltransferase
MKDLIYAMRLRTIPLSLSGVILGAFLAKAQGFWNSKVFFWSFWTAILFQVLSNFSNDYGDGVKIQRVVQKMIKLLIFLSIISSSILISQSFDFAHFWEWLFFFLGGLVCISAAIKYTMGDDPYGYRGLGDVSVLIFFGLVPVNGTFYLYSHIFEYDLFLPATSVGLLSMAVLNLNNIRDIKSDRKNGKKTLAVRLGFIKAKIYHILIVFVAFFCSLKFILIKKNPRNIYQFMFLISFFPMAIHLKKVLLTKEEEEKKFDSELKKVSINTLIFSLLLGLGQLI